MRGEYKNKVKEFLENNVSQKIKIYFLESKKGWIIDTRKICNDIESDIVFIWIEDHICIKKFSIINSVVQEMYQNNIDYLIYAFSLMIRIRYSNISRISY